MEALLAEVAEVRCFSSGVALFQCLKEGNPDLFLLDIAMPDMDGMAVCRQLKNDFETQNVPVIFVRRAWMTTLPAWRVMKLGLMISSANPLIRQSSWARL